MPARRCGARTVVLVLTAAIVSAADVVVPPRRVVPATTQSSSRGLRARNAAARAHATPRRRAAARGAVISSSSSSSSRSVAATLRGGGATTKEAPTVPTDARAALTRAVCWTVAETALLYAALAWAASSKEPNLEIVAAIAVAYGASALADAVLAVTAAACSAPVRQLLVPGRPAGDAAWYAALPKPSWNPPAWLFPVMWLLIAKPTQVVALSRLRAGRLDVPARLLYALHLSLGDAWNRVFFGEQLVGWGVVVIYAFVATLAATVAAFARLDRGAALFLVPTLGWVLVASTLNLRIWQLASSKKQAS